MDLNTQMAKKNEEILKAKKIEQEYSVFKAELLLKV